MKSTLTILLLALSICSNTFAQVNDKDITQMMSQTVPDRSQISYNTAKQLPRLYREGKQDTLKAVVEYYLKTLGMGYTITPYLIIEKISKRSFNEELPNFAVIDTYTYHKLSYREYYEENIFKYLEWYRHLADMVKRDKYDIEVNDTYDAYLTFIRSLAKEQINKAYLSPVEKFLLQFYINPTDSIYPMLKGEQFNGTSLQRAYKVYQKSSTSLTGLHSSFLFGAWCPTGNLSLIGVHPDIGLGFGGRINKLTLDAAINVRFLKSPKDYFIQVDSNYYTTNYFLGAYIGLNAAYELHRKKSHELDVLIGFGYDVMDALPGDNKSGSPTKGLVKSLGSANGNFGLEYKLFVSQKTTTRQIFNYISLALKYNVMQYDNAGGTNLTGNAFTFSFNYGGYNRKIHNFYNDPLKYYNEKRESKKVIF